MKATENQVESFLKSLSYESTISFLEVGKDDSELAEIASKRGIVIPSPDLAIFKARYALIDKKNRNNCILEKEDVEDSLDTLIGKRVDIDHLTRKVIGYFLDAKLSGEEIVAYGALFKSSFGEEFDEIKRMMEGGSIGVSFEAWGEREFHSDKSYSLKRIHFAGGGMLLREQPAEPTARVLELAKIMTPPNKFLHGFNEWKETMSEKDELEFSRWFLYDMESIGRLLQEAKRPGSEDPLNVIDVLAIDFENSKVKCKGLIMPKKEGEEVAEIVYEVTLSPSVKTLESARTIVDIKEVSDIKTEPLKIEVPSKEEVMETTISTTTTASDTATTTVSGGGVVVIDSAKDEEIAQLKKQLSDKDAEIASLKEKVVGYEKAERDAKVAARRAELGDEYAKDLKDEQILDENEFEKAKLRKENAELKKQLEKAKVETPETPEKQPEGLEAGAVDKSKGYETKQKRVKELAFGEDKK